MRPAATLIAAAGIAACAPTEDPRTGIFLAGLNELARELPDARLPLCATLTERRPLEAPEWAFIETRPPPGFEDLANAAPAGGPDSLESVRPKLPRRWSIYDKADRQCFQFTRPFIRGRRAVVSAEFSGARSLAGTWNFWLRREADRWRVEAVTRGGQDI